MSKLIVDNKEIDVPPEYTLLQACEAAGAEIPRFCFHERLSIAGNCRMCLIEVVGIPKPQASCAMAVNLSVWENVEALERFVYQTVHKRFYGRRPEWFDKMDTPHFVMWWIPAGHLPSLEEAKERLEHLTAHGPSDHAFGWENLPAAQLWKTARCAPDEHAA